MKEHFVAGTYHRPRHRNSLDHLGLALVISLSVSGGACAATVRPGEPASDRPAQPGLTLRITPETSEVTTAKSLVVNYELENRGDRPAYVCQWPGIAFGGGWEVSSGETKGFGPGYPSETHLDRKYFIELKPGEALLGRAIVAVYPTEAGEIRLWGVFRSGQRGTEYGLSAWKGEVTSEPVTIHVPKE
jgi:hypothetical protein